MAAVLAASAATPSAAIIVLRIATFSVRIVPDACARHGCRMCNRTDAATRGRSKRSQTAGSPQFRRRAVTGHFGDAFAGSARRVGRQFVRRKEAMRDDFVVRLRQADLSELTQDIERDVCCRRRGGRRLSKPPLKRSKSSGSRLRKK